MIERKVISPTQTNDRLTSDDVGEQVSDNLGGALDKIKDPPRPENLVGTVVRADGVVMPPTQSRTETVAKKANSSVSPHPEGDGEFSPAELSAYASLIKKKPSVPQPLAVSAEVIMPTNPDDDAIVAAQVAEMKREADAKHAATEADKWNVDKANIAEPKLDKRQLYVLGVLWIGAVPCALIVYELLNTRTSDAVGGGGTFVMIIVYLLGFYGLVGWVPLVLRYIKMRKR